MKLQVMTMGRPREPFIVEGVERYALRLRPLLPVEWVYLPEPGKGRNITEDKRREMECDEFLKNIAPADVLFLLDELGKQFTSVEFSNKIYKTLGQGQGKLILLIGGPYGTSPRLRDRACEILSLSKMTFTHEMALLLLSEQIYRAAMIRSGSKYHH